MRLVIVGTGTDVGKTHVSACLLALARARGLLCRAYKPVATGASAEACEDAARHAEALGAEYVPPTFAYRRPVSPHLAAREEGRGIELDAVAARADELARGVDFLLVETAGGLFTPLGPGSTNLELALRLQPAVTLLVAPDRLGVLHDVTACVLAARASRFGLAALVLSAPAVPDESTGGNAAELALLGLVPVAGVFPRGAFADAESQAVAGEVWGALGFR